MLLLKRFYLLFYRGLIVSTDKTQELMQKGFWASYNIP